MKKIIFILFAILPLIMFAQNDKEAERRVKTVVSELKQSVYEGRFTLLYYNAQAETTDKQLGDLTIKGDKFRMTLGANETKFDGRTQWVFVSEYNEVSITEPKKEELREINPLAMIEYYVSKDKISQSDDGAINFYPTNPKESEYFRIELRLNKTNLPSRLVIHQKNGDKITLIFDTLNKTKVNDDCFVFDVVKYPNVEVNDLR
ncbi:MAG: outer membrane lipoprotein carrier protein LolA [Paludibacteraceae bacterium]|nr:outer membrane lipoprotein carrier protein LolA [Paludibacteraceae bacterium]